MNIKIVKTCFKNVEILNYKIELCLLDLFVILLPVGEIVLIYLPAKAVDVGLNREQGALIMSIYGAVFAFSQIVVGILADLIHIPTSYLLMFSLLGMSVIAVAFVLCNSFSLFVLCASLFAICNGKYLYTIQIM